MILPTPLIFPSDSARSTLWIFLGFRIRPLFSQSLPVSFSRKNYTEKQFSVRICNFLAVILITFSCGSCKKDDPELVKKSENQKSEISHLKLEILVAEEKLKETPADVSEDLKQAKKEKENQMAEIARLEKSITDIASRKSLLQKQIDSYRSKYQLK